jgi:hypothetical protein
MLPIVWDFGQLNEQVEILYINQLVKDKFKAFNLSQNQIELLVSLLVFSQEFMRLQQNECSFVSLQDIQSGIKVI